ncbi:MAG: MATE family efflux transporter [Lachnospiraceae bacterium]
MGFYKKFFSLYIIFFLQNVVTLGVNLLDNVMIGGYSEAALSGVAAVNQLQFVYQQLLSALGEGLVMFGSQYWGNGQREPIKNIAAAGMQAALLLAVLLSAAVSLFPRQLMGFFTNSTLIIEEGAAYLNIIRFSYLFFAITMLILATLRSAEVVKIGFILSVLAFLINAVLNYALIYGHFGAPEMGAAGAAIATLTARISECLIAVWYALKKVPVLSLKIGDYLKRDRILGRDYLKAVTPMALVSGLWGVSTALQTVILGHMSAAALAANSAASVLFLLVKGGAVSGASAGAILIGKAIGMGQMETVRQYAKRLQRLFLLIGIVGGIILFFVRIPVLSFYNLSPETKAMANQFLIILSVVYVGMGYQMSTSEGIIRGGGSALFVVKMNLISIWGIVLPLSFVMAFVLKTPPAAVVCCLNADQIFKCVPVFLKANYGSWARKLIRE